MAVRLQKLLEKVTDQEITVLAGREGLKNPIRWMHMVEGVEISTFLEGGEMAFVTGIALAGEEELTELDGPVHYAVVGGQIALLAANLPLERTTALLTQLLAFCRREMPDCPLYCGAGRATQSIRCVHKTYLLAQRVLKLQRKRGTAWTSAAYEDLNVYRLLMAVEDGELLREYVTAALGPLLACDETGGSGHIAFLTAWMECNGSIQRTAERLFLHRNTVEYHLKRIGTLLGRDLGDLDTRMELWLALKLLNLQ